MKNIRFDVEYDGSDFCGWQRQPGGIQTLQGELEAQLGRILQENISLTAAGRTDKGVHARLQVVNFMTGSAMELSKMAHALNSLLPDTVRVSNPHVVPLDFHARFSAKEREYRYFLLEEPSALRCRFTGCSKGTLHIGAMQDAAGLLVGEHDFLLLSKEPADKKNPVCLIQECEWQEENGVFVFRIRANRFLRSMVRYLVGVMIAVGRGRAVPEDLGMLLDDGLMTFPLFPAEPNGLFLWDVSY
ncbi:MAG: tRNA pseudouridine(38-40) synthase TruA [Chlorobium limicola]|jgi:tRNA pseudouridine38-40 synthase|nr:tRNA pseudouridine(38-40) synthase TruA [Chlorobium limicola]